LFPWLNVCEHVVFVPQVLGVARADYEVECAVPVEGWFVGSIRVCAYPYDCRSSCAGASVSSRVLLAMSSAGAVDGYRSAPLECQTLAMQQLLLDVWPVLAPRVLFVTHASNERFCCRIASA